MSGVCVLIKNDQMKQDFNLCTKQRAIELPEIVQDKENKLWRLQYLFSLVVDCQ